MSTLVLSDIHIGDPRLKKPREKQVIDLLYSRDWESIVLNGDIVDLWTDTDIESILTHQIVTELRLIGIDTHIFWLIGNHDHGINDLFKTHFPEDDSITFLESLRMGSVLFIHGHQLDLAQNRWWYAKLGTKFNLWWWKTFKFDIQMWYHTTKSYAGECHSDRKKLLKSEYTAPTIVMGHTHRVGHQFEIIDNDVGQEVYDIGSIMELGTYGIIENNRVSLHRV